MAARPPLGFCGKLDNTGRDGAQARKVTEKRHGAACSVRTPQCDCGGL